MKRLKLLLKKYFSSLAYFYSYLKYRILIMLMLSFFVGILDGLGLTMFLPLLKIANGNGQTTGDGLGKMDFLIEGLQNMGISFTILNVLIIMMVFFALKGLMLYFSLGVNVKITQYFISRMRIRLTQKFTRYSFKHFVTSDVGRIQNTMTGEINRVMQSYKSYSEGIQQIILVLVYLSFVFLVDWRFALLVSIGGISSNFFFKRLFQSTKKHSAELTKSSHNFQGLLLQYITNFKYLKATGVLKRYAHKLKQQIRKIEYSNTKIGFLNARINALREPVLIGVVCIVIILQIKFLGGSLSGIMISLLFFYRALSSLMIFQNKYNTFLSVSGSLDNVIDFEKELVQHTETTGKEVFTTFQKEIRLQGVSFGFETDIPILQAIDLTLPKKKTLAFVGESGSGKTTLVNLMGGLLLPDSGTISVDGIPYSKLDINTFQNRLGYISQDPVIFNDTVFNNVTLWAEPTAQNKKQFEKALEKALLKKFIATLQNRGETILGNNGINLSGGQKQRISIARELYKEIDILILDEATSALDTGTEKEIQNNIEAIQGDYTLIIIAHRLSTIKNADEVLLMEKGRISQRGNFKELYQASNRFKKMVDLQEV